MFDSLSDFLTMGGHGLYVWLAYGSALLVVVLNVVSVRIARARYFRQAQAVLRREQADAQRDADTLNRTMEQMSE